MEVVHFSNFTKRTKHWKYCFVCLCFQCQKIWKKVFFKYPVWLQSYINQTVFPVLLDSLYNSSNAGPLAIWLWENLRVGRVALAAKIWYAGAKPNQTLNFPRKKERNREMDTTVGIVVQQSKANQFYTESKNSEFWSFLLVPLHHLNLYCLCIETNIILPLHL